MKHSIVFLALLTWLHVAKSDEVRHAAGTAAFIKIGKVVQVTMKPDPIFKNVVVNFSVTSSDSSPPSVVVSGKVVSNNSGSAQEFVPLFFGSSNRRPLLAALTNVDGQFRFRVWLPEKQNAPGIPFNNSRLRALNLNSSSLYLGGEFNSSKQMISSSTYLYPLSRKAVK